MPLSSVKKPDNHDESRDALRLWIQMLSLTTMVEKKIRRKLQEKFDTTLPRFDVLATLERAGEKITMGELSRRLLVSKGNVTWVVNLLVKQGLVRREQDKGDKRTHHLSLTEKGRREFRAQAAAHRAWITETLSGLNENETGEVVEKLMRLKEAVKNNQTGEGQ